MKKVKFSGNLYLLIILILIAFSVKLFFSAVIPLWHTPDEQAHFSQVAYFVEFGHMPNGALDLNKEIYESEVLLGTARSSSGENKFTYHPEYNIEYNLTFVGVYEKQINNFSDEDRIELVGQEAARYPPLYYILTGIPYQLFYNHGLIERVFYSRFVSILIGLLMFILCIPITKLLFPTNKLLQITLLVLMAFHPMLNFVSSGVTSDNLLNLLFTVVLLIGLLIIKNGLKGKYILGSIVVIFLLYFTKPQFALALPILFVAFLLGAFLNKQINRKTILAFAFLGVLLIILLFLGSKNTDFYEFIQKFYTEDFFPGNSKNTISVLDFIKVTLNKTIHETIPWYWGVYKWLSLVLPIEVIRLLNRLMIVAVIGMIIKLLLIFRNKRVKEDYMFIFLLVSSITYALGIFYYDFLRFNNLGFSFGIQGRYFFPLIVAHMALLLIGLNAIFPSKFPLAKTIYVKMIGLSMIGLFLLSTWVVLNSYYDLNSLTTFITQSSQYKPWIYKGVNLIIILVLNIVLLFLLLIKYLSIDNKSNNSE